MANYTGVFRSNYFAVKDEEAFRAFCEGLGLTVVVKDGLFGFLPGDNESIPFYDDDKDEDFDFCACLAPHIADDHVAVIQEAGFEKLRYVFGGAWAVNNKGDVALVTLSDIYDKAKTLGGHCTEASY